MRTTRHGNGPLNLANWLPEASKETLRPLAPPLLLVLFPPVCLRSLPTSWNENKPRSTPPRTCLPMSFSWDHSRDGAGQQHDLSSRFFYLQGSAFPGGQAVLVTVL